MTVIIPSIYKIRRLRESYITVKRVPMVDRIKNEFIKEVDYGHQESIQIEQILGYNIGTLNQRRRLPDE